MTKVRQRNRLNHKKRQRISKRNGLLHRPRCVVQSGTTTRQSGFTERATVVPEEKAYLLNELKSRCADILSTPRRLGETLGYTVNLFNSKASLCVTLTCDQVSRAVFVVKDGKDRARTTFAAFMYNGYEKFKKAVDFVGDVLFPSRPYKRKLDEMCGRLEEVEKELKKMRSEAIMLNEQRISLHDSYSASTGDSQPTSHSLPPPPALLAPPPPPPPPPPPISKPPEPITFKKKTKDGEPAKKATAKVGITLQDLASVKLKKVVREEVKENDKENVYSPLTFSLKKHTRRDGSPLKQLSTVHPFITLKDIKKVSLRKTETNTARKSRSPGHSRIAFLKTNLRKVRVDRSPGGTPCAKKPKVCHGEGITPIITRALQRKFKLANPVSPKDLSFDETMSFFETSRHPSPVAPKTRSPLATASPRDLSTQSPLTRSSLSSTPLTRLR